MTTAAPPAYTWRARRHILSRVASRAAVCCAAVLLGAPSGPQPLPPSGSHTSHDATRGVTLHYTPPPLGQHSSPSPRPRASIRALLTPRPHHPTPAGPHTTHHTRCVRLLLLCRAAPATQGARVQTASAHTHTPHMHARSTNRHDMGRSPPCVVCVSWRVTEKIIKTTRVAATHRPTDLAANRHLNHSFIPHQHQEQAINTAGRGAVAARRRRRRPASSREVRRTRRRNHRRNRRNRRNRRIRRGARRQRRRRRVDAPTRNEAAAMAAVITTCHIRIGCLNH